MGNDILCGCVGTKNTDRLESEFGAFEVVIVPTGVH